MAATIIDGKIVAEQVKARVKTEVQELKAKCGVTPGLATVLIGERPDSKVYVASKQKSCQELGMNSFG